MRLGLALLVLFIAGCAAAPLEYRRVGNRGQCPVFSGADRARVLKHAHPANYPRSRYRKGAKSPEVATDCSHFVHEVYRRAGLPYRYRDTAGLAHAPEFDLLPEHEARPGDLMLFRGHVGIVDHGGRIISATLFDRRPGSIRRLSRDSFPALRGQRYVLRYRCGHRMAESASAKR